ncbi:EamA-like transporter family protein [Pseudomonas oleovorans subsp. oleovorans]|jgi:transporter family protein|uniref:Transporter n=1 Tax=Ectopseudomonas oleovorans TaxID=301 RepID=A0A379PL11_ECTOL|nr:MULTISPECIES: EamA family transporter [Pseudomonas aeruginosa group]MCV0358584.1 EamA family transporter [Pseudomonas aeruginosa]OWK41510.1 EamA-like transporter family protein [Pseudomonas oleovorans subsp. oleovorans]SEJ96338.1 transporter family protein [Pseudomonas oleovorans]SUE72418.1 transporter [Pseudomonas oleovorans]HCE6536729.1 EamA family transporter [Pseudomonas aeruginosa]
MEKWVLYAFISMFFAGFTSVIAKMGLNGISGELGLTIRTLFVCTFVLIFAAWAVPVQQIAEVNQRNLLWLGLSGITTALSWIFYYKALKLGDVATVALIDKGSVVVAMLMAWLLLREVITLRMLAGAGLIVAGLLVIAKKP